jgi:hypothetical protein
MTCRLERKGANESPSLTRRRSEQLPAVRSQVSMIKALPFRLALAPGSRR